MIGQNYVCDGQMSLFDFVQDEPKTNAPILLFPDQEVFRVNKGDVMRYRVLADTWTHGDSDRGYRLMGETGTYWTAHNSQMGESIFTVRKQAEYTAQKYISAHDVILADDMRETETIAYAYIREFDGRKMIAFYSVLDNGYVYMKEFMTYAHLVKGNKAIKDFMRQYEIEKAEKIDYVPVFKNMYRCKGDSGWIYAEAEYNG